MKNSWLKKIIKILLLLDALVGTTFGVHIYLSNDTALFDRYYLLVFYATIFDIVTIIYLIVKLVLYIIRKIKEKRIAVAEEKARLEKEQRKKSERQKSIEAENKRIAQVKEKINNIIKRYKTSPLPSPPVINDVDIYENIENVQAVQMVKKCKTEQISDINECSEVDARISEILDADREPDEKLNYLQSNTDVLDSLKSNSDELHLRISNRKINIATENGDKSMMGSLLEAIGTSEKCVSNRIAIKDLITNEEPTEYGLFACSVKPTILKYNNNSYCIFDNIVLVFDRDGIFLTAIKPSSLVLSFKKQRCYIDVTNDCPKENEYIGKDSRRLNEGETTYSWWYMRKDGLPDRRHTYNPRISYRRDEYEYGILSFKLLDTTLTYSFSSASAINHALELSYRYDTREYDNAKLFEIIYD